MVPEGFVEYKLENSAKMLNVPSNFNLAYSQKAPRSMNRQGRNAAVPAYARQGNFITGSSKKDI
jgi:hypothetical protein